MPKKKQIIPNSLLGGESNPQLKGESSPITASSSSLLNGASGSMELKPVGLYNLGNTCFFNSTLQALLATESLISKLGIPSVLYTYDTFNMEDKLPPLKDSSATITRENLQDLETCFPDCDDESKRRPLPYSVDSLNEHATISFSLPRCIQLLALLNTFRSFAIEVRKNFFLSSLSQSQSFSYLPKNFLSRSSSGANCPMVCPKSLFYSIASKWPVYRRLRQQDAHEFLRLFLEFLGDEEEKILKQQGEKKETHSTPPPEGPYVLVEEPNGRKNDGKRKANSMIPPTIVNRVFAGLTVSKIRCYHCNHVTASFLCVLC